MLILLEGAVMCFVLLLICVVCIANGPEGGAVFHEPEVQERLIAQGRLTKEVLKRRNAVTGAALFIPLFVLVPAMVYGVNGAQGFREAFWQMAAIQWIMQLFDRLFIDWYWVGRTGAWLIPGTEDLRPYIPRKTLIRKWMGALIMPPAISALIAWIVSLF